MQLRMAPLTLHFVTVLRVILSTPGQCKHSKRYCACMYKYIYIYGDSAVSDIFAHIGVLCAYIHTFSAYGLYACGSGSAAQHACYM